MTLTTASSSPARSQRPASSGSRRRARRTLAVAGLAVAALAGSMASASAASASAANTSAQPGPWIPIQAGPSDAACGSTVVHVSFPVLHAFYRVTNEPDTSVLVETKGYSISQFATDAGATRRYLQVGPGWTLYRTDGSYESFNVGAATVGLTPDEVPELGAPSEIFYAIGVMDFVTHQDGSITPVRVPRHLVDVCAALGAS